MKAEELFRLAEAGKTWDATARSVNAVPETYRRISEPSEEEKAREEARETERQQQREAGKSPTEAEESADTVTRTSPRWRRGSSSPARTCASS